MYQSRVDCICRMLPRIFEAAGVEATFHLADVIQGFFESHYFRHP
eukprot:GSA25T00023161001.1